MGCSDSIYIAENVREIILLRVDLRRRQRSIRPDHHHFAEQWIVLSNLFTIAEQVIVAKTLNLNQHILQQHTNNESSSSMNATPPEPTETAAAQPPPAKSLIQAPNTTRNCRQRRIS